MVKNPAGESREAEGGVHAASQPLKQVLIPKKIVTNFLKGIFEKTIIEGQPDIPLWKKTYKELFSSFESGYGKSLAGIKYNTVDYQYLHELKYNTAVFSAFKQNEQIKDAAKLLIKEDGSARTWKEFRDAALQIDDQYNKRWLQAEYNQAHTSALQARRWRDAEKTADLYPNLIFIAVQDNRTRDAHAKLHGTIRSINDSFWNTHTPPLDWGCRCTFRPTDKKETEVPGNLPRVAEGLDVNTGKDAKIFSDNHPYIKGSANQASELTQFVNTQLNTK